MTIKEQDGSSFSYSDLQSKLFEENIVVIEGAITEESIAMVKYQLLYLNSKEDCKEIRIYINTHGGDVNAGLAIIDIINIINKPIHVYCMGSAMSMGFMILISATGKRKMLPNSTLMIHSISTTHQGTIHEIQLQNEVSNRLQGIMEKKILEKTKIPKEKLENMLSKDTYIYADEAIELGIVDEIL